MSDYQVYTLKWMVNSPLQYLALKGYCARQDLQLQMEHRVGMDPCSVMWVQTVIKAVTPERAIEQVWEGHRALQEQGFYVRRQCVMMCINNYETQLPILQRDHKGVEFRVTVSFVTYESLTQVQAAAKNSRLHICWSLPLVDRNGILKMVAALDGGNIAEVRARKNRFLELVQGHDNGRKPVHCQEEIYILNYIFPDRQ